MKTFRYSFLLSLLASLGLVALAHAASAPVVEVTVSNSAGKVVYKGTTGAGGAFATPNLAAGKYTVQFNSKGSLKGGPFTIAMNAGKEKMGADSVPAGKFSRGGVAMKITVDHPMNLTGEIAVAGATKAVATTATNTKSNGKVKYINGRKYVWVPAEPGSWNGGKWVEEGSIEARNAEGDKRAKEGPAGGTTEPDR